MFALSEQPIFSICHDKRKCSERNSDKRYLIYLLVWFFDVQWDVMATYRNLPGKFTSDINETKFGNLDRRIFFLVTSIFYDMVSYVFTVYMTHRLSVYILYRHTNDALILVTSYLHIHFSYVHEYILTALNCAVFVLLMHVFLWLSLLILLYIVRNDYNKYDQSIINMTHVFQWLLHRRRCYIYHK